MKIIFRLLLACAIVLLAYVSYLSIMNPIRFKKEREQREKAIIARLIDIRKAENAYKSEFNTNAGSFDQLISWLNDGRLAEVRKEGELSQKQLENGMTESKAVAIIEKAKKTNNWRIAEKEGLSSIVDGKRVSFTRDTTWVNPKEALFGEDYDVSQLGTVPGTTAKFELDTATIHNDAGGFDIKVFQASVPYTVYLSDLNQRMVRNLIDFAKKTEKYPGLKVGSLTEANNSAGNWE